MSNFVKKRIVRESTETDAGSELDGMFDELDVAQEDVSQSELEGVLLAEDTSAIEGMDALVAPANDAMDEQMKSAIAIAQEAIHARWCIDSPTVGRESYGDRGVARESIWESIKAMLRKFIDWLKEIGAKIRERWVKFSNSGKKIQEKAKAYLKKIEGLTTKKEDTVRGDFIKHLTENSKFIGEERVTIKQATGMLKELSNLIKAKAGSTISAVKAFNAVAKDDYNKGLDVLRDKSPKPKTANYLGNKTVLITETKNADIASYTPSFIDTVGATVPAQVNTPDLVSLKGTAEDYGFFGKAVEDFILDRRKNDAANAELTRQLEEVLKIADGLSSGDENKPLSNAIKVARRFAQHGTTVTNMFDTVAGHMVISLSKGLPGYIDASIKAYK